MAYLSISFDLTDSTLAKALISEIAATPDHRKKLIEQFHRHLTQLEVRLYFLAFRKRMDLKKLFLVKNIGDELWYFLEFEDSDSITKDVFSLIEIAEDLVSKSANFNVSEREATSSEEAEWATPPSLKQDRVPIPLKCYMEIVEDFSDLTVRRFEIISEEMRKLTRSQTSATTLSEQNSKFEELLLELAPRLNLGHVSRDEQGLQAANIRFDPIGRDIDLFFRCAKFSLPGLLSIGKRLFDRMKETAQNGSLTIRVPQGNGAIFFTHRNYIQRPLKPDQLKGTGTTYDIFYLPVRFAENLRFHTRWDPDGFAESRKLLIKAGFLKRNLISNLISWVKAGTASYPVNRKKWTHFNS